MKHFNFGKWLMMLALVIIVQNGSIIVHNTAGDAGSNSGNGEISTYSDMPCTDDCYT